MLLHLLIFFRVTSPDHINFIKKHIKDQVVKACETYQDMTLENTEAKTTEYYFCDRGGFVWDKKYLNFYNCKFINVQMIKASSSYLIHSKNAFLEIISCSFDKNKYYDKMVYFEGDNDLKFHSNIITSCNSFNNEARVIYSESKSNDIQYNSITFDEGISKGQAYYLYYTKQNTAFAYNTVKNAVCDRGSCIYTRDEGNKNDLQINHCVFSNCAGTNGAVLYIQKLPNHLTMQNVTFEHFNDYNNGEGYMIHIEANYKNPEMNFIDCKFIDLECDSRGGGGIGLLYYTTVSGIGVKDSHKHCKIKFEHSTFEHIKHVHDTIGGGAIAIDKDNNNKWTDLTIDDCTFNDISDAHAGGAIYFNSPEKTLNINRCTFQKISSSEDGQSIYVKDSNSYTITIQSNSFIDCGSQPSFYVININCLNLDFLYNKITFSNPSNSCGCIKSNKYYIHKYKGNVFTNARSELAKNSAGIDNANSGDAEQIEIIDNVFDCISGPCEGRCLYINFNKESSKFIISNNTFQNCPSGGILVKFEFGSEFKSLKFSKFQFIQNSINDASFNEMQICPQIYVQNIINGDFSSEISLEFDDCLFKNNKSPKKGGALAYGKYKYISNTKLTFTNCKFIDNKADEGGSALSIITYQGCKIDNCEFIQNKSEQGSGLIYIETEFQSQGSTGYPATRNPTIDINNCIFNSNEGKTAGILINSSPNAPVIINDCSFTNCGNSGHVIDIQSNVKSVSIINCPIKFDSSICSGGIHIKSKSIIDISYVDFISTSVDSALSIESEEATEEKVSITQCLFDSCTGKGYSCFYISTQTTSFTFNDITVRNIKLTGCTNYLGTLKLNGQMKLTLTNVSFTNCSSSSLYGGGTGMTFSGITELVFVRSNFNNNEAHQDKSMSRPIGGSDTNPYYNGDGGALQIGCQSETANMILKFQNCNLQYNKAERHGGALAVQTIKELELFECKVENNIADYDFESSSSNLLFENYFHLKKEGRGGAIYLNPASGCVDSFTEKVTLNDCEISFNNAYDGYALYIEGDNPDTVFTIIKNNFNDNYNKNNYDDDPNKIYGAVITTEIHTITDETLRPPNQKENYNYFSYSSRDIIVSDISYVDHSGKTKTKEFTPSDYFPTKHFSLSDIFSFSFVFSNTNLFSNSNNFSPSDHFPSSSYFTGSNTFSKSQYFTESDAFSKSVQFTKSDNFLQSSQFTESNGFSNSNKFTGSDQFSKSQYFTKTDLFSQTDDFSKTNEFTKSDAFSNSDPFIKTSEFSNSNKFTGSDSFTKTQYFTKSDDFSNSNQFTKSNDFSKTIQFSESSGFSKSNAFSPSNKFTNSDKFSESQVFSQSNDFSESNKFTLSNPFNPSDAFTGSNKFSETQAFSNTAKFTFSKEFSQSNDFSESSKFTLSNPFNPSDAFTGSNKFSETQAFSSTAKFTFSKEFSQSKDFSESSKFTLSNAFNPSDAFTGSNKFSETQAFSNTGKFSNTEYFSQSTDFSESNKFTLSNAFNPSDIFSGSNKFSETQGFTNTGKFSSTTQFTISKEFSQSSDFTESNKFSKSNPFDPSSIFSRSNKFSETQAFSSTGKFSNTELFSISNDFSKSIIFSESGKFSNSNKFSETNKFSPSNYFSKTNPFSTTEEFSYSNPFSPSQDFTPSATPNTNQLCGYWEDGEFKVYDNCDFEITEEKYVYIHVLSSNFTSYDKNEDDGGAIHLVNCGIHCNDTVFIDCVSYSGGGGGIYINNTFDMVNNATFRDVLFLRCKASYGGAVFIYADSENFNTSFTRCNFESNVATLTKPSNGPNPYLFGGSAMYLMTRNFFVENSTFTHNNGGSVKVYNKFDQTRKIRQLEEKENYIIGCHFDEDDNSKGAINYIDEKSGSNLEVIDCEFKGKLQKGSHFIDGKMLNKEKIRISSCNFENDINNSVNIDLINDDFMIKVDETKDFSKYKIISALFLAVMILIAMKLIIYYYNDSCNKNKHKYLMNEENYEESFKSKEIIL